MITVENAAIEIKKISEGFNSRFEFRGKRKSELRQGRGHASQEQRGKNEERQRDMMKKQANQEIQVGCVGTGTDRRRNNI